MPLWGLFPSNPSGSVKEIKKKKSPKDTLRYTLKQSFKKSLGQGVLMKEAVKCPEGESVDEWIAMNTLEIYNSTNLCFGFVSDFCTPKSCPTMTAGPKYSYLWQDDKIYTKPTSVSASEYIELLMSWVSSTLDDVSIFPQSGKFPKTFLPIVKKIWKRLARVYFHIYYHHWKQIEALNAESHVNTCLKHFFYFSSAFQLVSDEDLEPMSEIAKQILS